MLGRLDVFPSSRLNLKDSIIRTLTSSLPLTARNLFLEIRQSQSSNVTYQAVHKALKQLKEQRIVLEDARVYSLNPAWVDGLKQFALDLDTSFSKKRPASILTLPVYGSAAFENTGILVEPYFWMLDQTHRIWSTGTPIKAVFFTRRAYPLIVMANREYAQFMDSFKDKDQFVLVKENKPADQFFIKIWKDYGLCLGTHFGFCSGKGTDSGKPNFSR